MNLQVSYDGETWTTTAAEMLSANEGDQDVAEAVARLECGETTEERIGGGAAPVCVMRRVAVATPPTPEALARLAEHSEYGRYGLPPDVCETMRAVGPLAQLGARVVKILRDKDPVTTACHETLDALNDAARSLGLLGDEGGAS